jgi:hypothetical protein
MQIDYRDQDDPAHMSALESYSKLNSDSEQEYDVLPHFGASDIVQGYPEDTN